MTNFMILQDTLRTRDLRRRHPAFELQLENAKRYLSVLLVHSSMLTSMFIANTGELQTDFLFGNRFQQGDTVY